MNMSDQTYLDTLLLYYEEEIEGEAYFAELSQLFSQPDHKEKLTLLAKVESHAANAIEPLLARHGLQPRPRQILTKSGRDQARATAADWPALLADMNQTYPGYLEDFRALETMAPAPDRDRLGFLTEHEVAAIAFLAREVQGDANSVQPLNAYLAADPATWCVGRG
jgi:hypothetical protein